MLDPTRKSALDELQRAEQKADSAESDAGPSLEDGPQPNVVLDSKTYSPAALVDAALKMEIHQ